MKTVDETAKALNVIREALDADVIGADIDSVQNKLLKLTQLMGTSAEANASAKKLLSQKELEIMMSMDKKLAPSIQSKFLNAQCFEQEALLEYADRLNAGIVHACESLRTVISLYKEEMRNSLGK